jgi:hypothetical protein
MLPPAAPPDRKADDLRIAISAMTGGTADAERVNTRLGAAALGPEHLATRA